MSQGFNQQAYPHTPVYLPPNLRQAYYPDGRCPQPFVPFQGPTNANEEQDHHSTDEEANEEGQGPLQRRRYGAARDAPNSSSDSSESENDDPATRVAKQLLRKRPASSSKQQPPRHDFKKSQVRVRIRQAKERLENAQHAVQEAAQAHQNAQTALETRETEWQQLNEELVDELLQAEKMRPWNKVYFQLQEYKTQHGHISLAARATTNKRRRETTSPSETHEEYLGGWITRQRGDRSKGKLDEWKILALNRLGFVWDGLEGMWQNSYQKVKEFYAQHGHINIQVKQDKPLNRWLKTQRATYKEYKTSGFAEPGKFGCKMNKERKELLDALGMDWDDEDQDDGWWIRPFHQLKDIRQTQGHLRTLPAQETALLDFCARQRTAYKDFLANECQDCFEMTAERVSLLNSIQFPWIGTATPFGEETKKRANHNSNNDDAVVIAHSNPWMTQYNHIQQFAAKYGHLKYTREEMEPRDETTKLQNWDAMQRKHERDSKKTKFLSPERMELLNAIKFFQPPHEREFWFRLHQLRKFHARHGHAMILYKYPGAPKSYQELAHWAMEQRKQYRKFMAHNSTSSTLTDEKVAFLKHLGFNFDLMEAPICPTRAAALPAAEGILEIAKQAPKKGTLKAPPPPKQSTAAKSPRAKSAKPPPPAQLADSEEPPAKRKRGRPKKNT